MLFYKPQEFSYIAGLSREPRLYIQRKRHLFRPLSEWPQMLLHSVVQRWHPSRWVNGWSPISPGSLSSVHVLSHLSGSPFTLWGLLFRSMGPIMGCRGKASQDSTRLIMGCLGEEPRVRKGTDLGDLGTCMGKQRKKWIKGADCQYTDCCSVHFYDCAQFSAQSALCF